MAEVMVKWLHTPKQNLTRRNRMKRPKLIQICFLFLLCMVVVSWTTLASGQPKPGEVAKEAEKYMPLCTGVYWQKMVPDAKVAFIWGAAHVILIEAVLMQEMPQLKVQSFSAKVVEARQARKAAGTAMTINQIISAIDQYYKDHPKDLELPVLRVIWEVGVKPNLKTGLGGQPIK
jgi:hypothetical protein